MLLFLNLSNEGGRKLRSRPCALEQRRRDERRVEVHGEQGVEVLQLAHLHEHGVHLLQLGLDHGLLQRLLHVAQVASLCILLLLLFFLLFLLLQVSQLLHHLEAVILQQVFEHGGGLCLAVFAALLPLLLRGQAGKEGEGGSKGTCCGGRRGGGVLRRAGGVGLPAGGQGLLETGQGAALRGVGAAAARVGRRRTGSGADVGRRLRVGAAGGVDALGAGQHVVDHFLVLVLELLRIWLLDQGLRQINLACQDELLQLGGSGLVED